MAMILHNPFGPIFEKELRATSRRKRTYALRAVYLAGLLMFLVLAYASSRSYSGGGVAQRVMQQNQLGQMFFIFFSLFCVGAMTMIGPVLTCTAISAERLHKTLHVLLMTPITGWQIITGKLISRLLAALTLIGLSLPVLALVRLLGGVEVAQMFGVVAIATTTAVVTAALGLFISTFVNRAYAAILLAYATILLFWFFVPMMVVASQAHRNAPPAWALSVISTVSPPACTVFIISPVGALFGVGWTGCVVTHLVVAGALVLGSALMLRRLQRREGMARRMESAPGEPPPPGVPPTASPDLAVGTAAPPPVPGEHRKTRGRRKDVSDNPVLWRELGRPLFPRRWQSIVAGASFVGLLMISYMCFASADALDDRELQMGFACAFNGVAWLVLSVLSATAIAQEKESDTWTLLLATPLSGRAVVLGKLLGLYRRLLWPSLLIAAHFALFAVFGVIGWLAALLVMWIIFSFNTVWVASGLFLSLKLRKVTFAVIFNLALAMVAYIAVPIALGIFTELQLVESESAEQMLWGLPYFYLAEGVYALPPDASLSQSKWLPGREEGVLADFLQAAVVAGLAHLAVAGAILGLTILQFNRIVGRADQHEPLPPPSPHLTQNAGMA